MSQRGWLPPAGVLGRIVSDVRARLAERPDGASLIEAAEGSAAPPATSFAAALRGAHVAVIAEVKRRSPSKGAINAGLSAPDQAAAYARGGAAAISVLTEPDHFGGSLADLEAVRSAVALPLLRKDFVVDPVQLAEARLAGATAALLIARALSPDALASLAESARRMGLEVLVEIRSEWELERAMGVNARTIGVNCRDLETLRIEPALSERLLPLIPGDRIAVAESGVQGPDDVRRLAAVGADAILVGSSVSAAADPEASVRALTMVARVARAG